MLADLREGSWQGSYPSHLVVYMDKLFFRANDGISGSELWSYDDKTGNLELVADINVGSGSSNADMLCILDGRLYFRANDGTTGSEIYVYDGITGAVSAKELIPGSADPWPMYLTVFDSKIFFTCYVADYGAELWSYDPVLDQYSMVADIVPGNAGSSPEKLTVIDGKLFLSANDGVHGKELWIFDSSLDTCYMVTDGNPGEGGFFPQNMYTYRGLVHFSGNDWLHGSELWIMCTSTEAEIFATGCDSYVSPSGKSWTQSGIYTDTIVNTAGCDSIIVVHLDIISSSSGTDVRNECDAFTWIDGNTYTENNNTASWTLTNAAGCDSLVVLDLTLKFSSSSILQETAIVGESYTAPDGAVYTESGVYTALIKNVAGCDSTITIDLDFHDPVGIVSSEGSGMARCYPNPVREILHVDFGQDFNGELRVISLTGRIIIMKKVSASKQVELETDALPAGIYLIRATGSGTDPVNLRFVKE